MEDPNEAIERRRDEEKKRKAGEKQVTEAIASVAACYSRVPHAAFMKAARELLSPRTVASLVETAYFGGAVARSIHRGEMAEAAICEWKEREGIADDQAFRERFAEVFPLAVVGDPPFQYLGFGAELLESPSVRHAMIDTFKDAMAGRSPGGRDPKVSLRKIGKTLSLRGPALRAAQARARKRDEQRDAEKSRVAEFLSRINEAIPKKCVDGAAGVSALPDSLLAEMEDFQFSPWDFSTHVNIDAPLWVGIVLAARRLPRKGGSISWPMATDALLHDTSDAQQEGDLDHLRERLKKGRQRTTRKRLGGTA